MPNLRSSRPQVSKTEQLVKVSDLTGGLNLRVSPTLLESDQSRQLRNFSPEEQGALVVRLGYTQFSTATLGNSRAQGGQRVYLSSHTVTLLAHDSTVYSVNDAGVASSVLSGLSTRQIYFPHDRDMVAVLDGVNRPKKSTDGTTWNNFGIDAPLAGPTASTLSSGVCSSGEYSFAYSYKNRALAYESNGSTGSTVTLTGSTGAFHLQAVASTDAQVDAYVWYAKDVSAGETVFRKVSSGAASTVRITSTNWTANAEMPTNHDVLSKGSFGVVWKNRWWITDPDVTNRLKFSELFLPQAFPALFYIDIPFRKGDSISAIAPLGDTLVVFGTSGEVFLVIGQTSLDFEVRPSAGAIAGCLGQRAWAQVEQGIIHAAAEGIYIFDGAQDRLLTHNIEKAWRTYITSASAADLAKTPMVYEFRHKRLRVAVTNLYPYGTAGEWELNLDRTRTSGKEAWAATDRAIGGYISYDGAEQTAGLRGELLTWHSSAGLLFKESTGTTANSSNMVADYEGPTLALGLHRARVLGLHVEYEPHAGALTSETVTDGVSQGQITLQIGSGIAQYGTAVYGTSHYGGSGRRKAYTPQKLDSEGRTVTLSLNYTGQEQARVFTYGYDILPESKPREFTE